VHLPDGEEGTIYDVAERYRAEGVPTIVIAGKSRSPPTPGAFSRGVDSKRA